MQAPYVSSDPQQLQIVRITNWLSATYWAKGRTIEKMQRIVERSFNYGLYLGQEQIGYARIVSDEEVFAYLMDVYIEERHRGNGYAHYLMKAITEDPRLKAVSVWRLATTDAHKLYEKYGFKPLASPEKMMEKIIQ